MADRFTDEVGTLFSYLVRIPYMEKHLRGKTFAFRVENGYLLENFHGSMLLDLYSQSTRPQFMGKDLRLSEKL